MKFRNHSWFGRRHHKRQNVVQETPFVWFLNFARCFVRPFFRLSARFSQETLQGILDISLYQPINKVKTLSSRKKIDKLQSLEE